MTHASRRTDFTGPALVRLLASLTRTEVPGSRQAFAERLSQWVGWADAIALSAALGPAPADAAELPSRALPPTPTPTPTPSPLPSQAAAPAAADGDSAEARDAHRTRAALAASMAVAAAWSANGHGPARGFGSSPLSARPHARRPAGPPAAPAGPAASVDGPPVAADFAPLRWHYLARQQAMDAALAPLRQRLRQSLSARSPALARLAAVDAVMERALGAQERNLLATVPNLLEGCFQRQREAAADGWLVQFQADLQQVLLAELDLRFLPLAGLLEALRPGAAPPGRPAPRRVPAPTACNPLSLP